MRVVEPHEFKKVKRPKAKSRHRGGLYVLLLGLVISVYTLYAFVRPLPQVNAVISPIAPTKSQPVQLDWPAYGQAAVGAVGYGVLDTRGEQKALPVASVAKVMTALTVLKVRPLTVGQQGPPIRFTAADVDVYYKTVAMGGSNVPVMLDEEISQYEALQAMLLPSANNMAYTLARWAFGSEKAYTEYANNLAKSLGMESSHFADASGFSSETVSTAEDLAKLAVNAMDNPVIAEIVGTKETTVPVAGQIFNGNNLLGTDNIVGIKTGTTEQAGGCFMAAAVKEIDGQKITTVSVIMGAPYRDKALSDSVPLVNSVFTGFKRVTLAHAGQVVGSYTLPWSKAVDVRVSSNITGIEWADNPVSPSILADSIRSTRPAGAPVGKITAQFGREVATSNLTLVDAVRKPPALWRLRP